MKVALFVPCYIDQVFPEVGVATLEVLEKLGCDVEYPKRQTCCGQLMGNSGASCDGKGTEDHFISLFNDPKYDYIVAPSGSCIGHVKDKLQGSYKPEDLELMKSKCYELVNFITDVLGIKHMDGVFKYKVGFHKSCHWLRKLKGATSSELAEPYYNQMEDLLKNFEGIEFVELDRTDECCGFGGTFSVIEEALSAKMGDERVSDHVRHGVEYIVSTDMSCLMHQKGIIERNEYKVRVLHIAQVLNGGPFQNT